MSPSQRRDPPGCPEWGSRNTPAPGPPARPCGRTTIGRLLERNRERILCLARRMRRSSFRGHRYETRDAVQDAAADLLSKPVQIRGRAHFLNLFSSFLRNVLRNERRRMRTLKRGASLSVEPLLDESVLADEEQTPPAGAAEKADARKKLNAALWRLERSDREVILLRLWEEKSWAEIASLSSASSEDAARMHYGRALARLRKLVPGLGPFEES